MRSKESAKSILSQKSSDRKITEMVVKEKYTNKDNLEDLIGDIENEKKSTVQSS
jgi:hypothetical protein